MHSFLRQIVRFVLLISIILFFVFAGAANVFGAQSADNSSRNPIQLPIGQTVLKIELNADAIYAITPEEMSAAGFDLHNLNPHQLVLMNRGQAVATLFEGDADSLFENGERLLFFGRKFTGTREEKQHVTTNVYWLWDGAVPTHIETIDNELGGLDQQTVSAEITVEPENIFSLTSTRYWNNFPNEFDAWYWAQMSKSGAGVSEFHFDIDLTHVVSTTGTVDLLVEILSQKEISRTISISLNDLPATAKTVNDIENVNLMNSIPQTALQNGANTLTIAIDSAETDKILLNRATLTYQRHLTANTNELIFGQSMAGHFTYWVNGFSTADASQLLVWDITHPNTPLQIDLSNQGSEFLEGGDYGYRIGRNQSADAQFIVTTQDNIQAPQAVSTYHVTDLNPELGAEWVAVAHADFVAETQRLAAHRAIHSRLNTHVVSVEDVLNQFGYGLPLPDAIRDYMLQARANWSKQPTYLLLVGDATLNPRQLPCSTCSSDWNTIEKTYVPIYLRPIDRSMGLAPSDHPYAKLDGLSHDAQISVGRLPVVNSAELSAITDKIITFENNLLPVADWRNHVQYISDDLDSAGDFCNANTLDAAQLPDGFDAHVRCLNIGDYREVDSLRTDMFNRINDGVLFNQYLGHGFITGWGAEGILTAADLSQFQNHGKPFVQISGSCLDSHFAWLGLESTGEAMLALPDAGSVAHWGATGLGFLSEHRYLHDGFYEAVFEHGITAMGDAISFAKNRYFDSIYYPQQAYSSVLLGDPAMQLVQPDLGLTIPRAPSAPVEPGVPFNRVVEVTNSGNLPVAPTVQATLPAGVVYRSVQADGAAQVEFDSGGATVNFTNTVGLGDSQIVTLSLEVVDPIAIGTGFTLTVETSSVGLEATPDNNLLDMFVEVKETDTLTVQLKQIQADGTNQMGWALTLTLLALTGISARLLPTNRKKKAPS